MPLKEHEQRGLLRCGFTVAVAAVLLEQGKEVAAEASKASSSI